MKKEKMIERELEDYVEKYWDILMPDYVVNRFRCYDNITKGWFILGSLDDVISCYDNAKSELEYFYDGDINSVEDIDDISYGILLKKLNDEDIKFYQEEYDEIEKILDLSEKERRSYQRAFDYLWEDLDYRNQIFDNL